MTPEQLDTLLDNANRGAFLAPSDPSAGYDARAAAASELFAMRQPITAEALKADGWRLDYEIASKGNFTGRKLFVFGNRLIGVSIWDDGDACLYYKGNGGYLPMPMPTNMHDLRELVRLLGGQP